MHGSLEREGRPVLSLRRPVPGVTLVRFSGDRPLMRAVPNHFGTSMHLVGRSHWTIGRTKWSSAPGSVGLKVPGDVAVEHAREGGLAFQVVLFDSDRVEEARLALERHTAATPLHSLDRRDPRSRPIVALHRRLLAEQGASSDVEEVQSLEAVTCEALHALVDLVFAPRGAEPKGAGFTAAVARARALLDERFTETIGLDDLARHARLDKFRLCRAFREQVGLPPHAYVTHRRIALAQDLLTRGVPQAEVAARVGFYDQSLMHRHFKRILRLTPGAFARGGRGRRDAAESPLNPWPSASAVRAR